MQAEHRLLLSTRSRVECTGQASEAMQRRADAAVPAAPGSRRSRSPAAVLEMAANPVTSRALQTSHRVSQRDTHGWAG